MRVPEISQLERAVTEFKPAAGDLLAGGEDAVPSEGASKRSAAARRLQSATTGFLVLLAVWLGY